MKTVITSLQWLVASGQRRRATYKVVKFIVKVKLIENKVKSHVGRVMVAKVMIQYSVPGSTVKTRSITRASRPKVEEYSVFSAALTETTAVCRASAMLVKAGKLVGTEVAAELVASAAAEDMVDGLDPRTSEEFQGGLPPSREAKSIGEEA